MLLARKPAKFARCPTRMCGNYGRRIGAGYAHDGDITLQGTVDDAAVLGRAVALAASTTGVQKVICELVILKSGSGK